MPSTFPSSFALAAAGNGSDSTSRRSLNRADSGGFAEWSRRPNGATQTFRRPSLATSNSHSAHHRDPSASAAAILSPSAASATYVPPYLSASRNGGHSDARYSRDQLLDLFKHHRDLGDLEHDLSDLYMGEPDHDALPSSTSRWSRRDDPGPDATSRPDVCLNPAADTEPLGLVQMSSDEQDLFATSVNSLLKAPNQASSKDASQRDGPGARKLSMSHSHAVGGLTSPTSARPLHRRREPSESHVAASRSGRDEVDPPSHPTLLRRKTDGKDIGSAPLSEDIESEEATSDSNRPFGLSRRVSTGPLSAGLNPPQSPWSQSAAGGAFGSFSMSNGSAAYPKRPGGGLVRGESRFKGLMSRDGADPTRSSIQERASQASLGQSSDADKGFRDDAYRQHSTDDPADFPSNQMPVGSAALGGANDEDSGPMSDRVSLGRDASAYGLHDARGQPQYLSHGNEEPLSPTFTNPYHSPEQDTTRLNDMASDDLDFNNLHLPGLGNFNADAMGPGMLGGTNQRVMLGNDPRPFERAQPFGHQASRGFPALGGIGGLPTVGSPTGWGTPTRERAFDGFGELAFRQDNPSGTPFAGLGGVASFNSAAPPPHPRQADRPGSMLGSSRLGSLFPTAMQEQIRSNDPSRYRQPLGGDVDRADEAYETFARSQAQGLNAGSMMPNRDTDSPFNATRAKTDEFGSTNESSPAQTSQRMQPIGGHTNPAKYQAADQMHQHAEQDPSASSNQPPAAQQKTMVMPDRIRWIYRDPQGATQGPWSGLEMHDWYRAGFFSPELLVKKVEDPDYEPLAQLIRRIGNSREPFLVPQIGIPGPPSSNAPPGNWPPQPTNVPPAAGNAQPPFASSFPTFGTTLTAEQQNALERRKQEEQYLMARQKEHLAQQQVFHKMQAQTQSFHGVQPQTLQHHSSAQSLQSQQSLGSMSSLHAFQNAPVSGAGMTGSFDGALRQAPSAAALASGADALGHIKEEEQTSKHAPGSHDDANAPDYQPQSHFSQSGADEESVAAALADRARLSDEQAEFDRQQMANDEQATQGAGRLGQFHQLRSEGEGDHNQSMYSRVANQSLTLTEQVQQAASAKDSPTGVAQPAWAKVEKPVVDSHSASQRSSPLPAPAARRSGGQSVADALAADANSQRNSPAIETPTTSVAPWAKESSEGQKQPSLKEIQAAEAKRAAKQEEMQLAMRRAALEKELAMANHAPAPAPGLPSSSTWGSGDGAALSPSTTGAPPWSKASTSKSSSAVSGSIKKTLQQIQKEEEALARKQKALAAGTGSAASNSAQSGSSGQRYADLASRTTESASPSASAWTTVGAGGKARSMAAAAGTPAAPPTTLNRAVSSSTAASVLGGGAARAKTTGTPVRTASSSVVPAFNAQDEFKKWAVGDLRTDLKKGIQVDDFVGTLLSLPPDVDLITEAVHSASSTMDSRHFAEEFVRRKALADKGKMQPANGASGMASQAAADGKGWSSGGGGSGGGWSEVASRKPSGAKEEGTAFKIVSKKKGGKR